MPGVSKIKSQMDTASGVDEKIIIQNEAINFIHDKKRKRKSKNNRWILGKKRIANGSGTDAATINKLLKAI